MPTVHRGRINRQRGLVARRFRNSHQPEQVRMAEPPAPAQQPAPQRGGRRTQTPTRTATGSPRLPPHLTVAGVAAMLAEIKDISEARGDLEKRYEQLRKQVDAVPAGLYEDWLLSWGTPHEIVDHEANAELLESLGYDVPKKLSRPPIQVDFVPQVHID